MITVAVGQFGSAFGRGLLQILDEDAGLRVVDAGLDRATLEAKVARGAPQVVILDEDCVSSPAALKRLCDAPPGGSGSSDVGLVVLAHRPSRAYVMRMLAFGVSVCLSTDASAQDIVRAVRLAAAGTHVFVSMALGPDGAGRGVGIGALTRREREVLELLGRGRKNAEIAQELQISTETARAHAKHVYRKLGVSSRAELLGIER